MKAELGVETLTNNQQIEANQKVNDMFAFVTMEHGMVVDTVATNVLGLQGTMKQVTVEAGKGIVTKENGFAHTLVNTNVPAFGAYIVADFDPESADVIGKLVVNIEGSVDTGINEVLNKVSQNGNIYNAAGQLVGKGNINTVNNLPAGIYVVNGVKVTKK
jgi:orotate phosphoribosyltransferase-like protein